MCSVNGEVHLFIIWENAREKQSKILGDIEKKFRILDVFDVSWSDKNFSSNLTRFYGQKLPNRSFKEKHCGKGPFLLVVVYDNDPIYENRTTSKGIARVNVRMFDCKELYRSWTGGGHKIHATNDIDETHHDLVLLMGRKAEIYLSSNDSFWDNTIKSLQLDLVGADGWGSLADFFYVLNNTINYVVLRNFDELPNHHINDIHGDIDLLTDDYATLCYVSNATKVFNKSYRVHYVTSIGMDTIYFDFRHVGDGYYDEKWQRNILLTRIYKEQEIFVPNDDNHFFSLLYHAAVHKPRIADDYVDKLLNLSNGLGKNISPVSFKDADWLCISLETFLNEKDYVFTDPKDVSVYLNTEISGSNVVSIRRKVRELFYLIIRLIRRRR